MGCSGIAFLQMMTWCAAHARLDVAGRRRSGSAAVGLETRPSRPSRSRALGRKPDVDPDQTTIVSRPTSNGSRNIQQPNRKRRWTKRQASSRRKGSAILAPKVSLHAAKRGAFGLFHRCGDAQEIAAKGLRSALCRCFCHLHDCLATFCW